MRQLTRCCCAEHPRQRHPTIQDAYITSTWQNCCSCALLYMCATHPTCHTSQCRKGHAASSEVGSTTDMCAKKVSTSRGIESFPAAHLSEVPRVELVEEDTVVVLSTGVTPPARMLPVLPDTPVARRDVPPLLAVLRETRRLRCRCRGVVPTEDDQIRGRERHGRESGVLYILGTLEQSDRKRKTALHRHACS